MKYLRHTCMLFCSSWILLVTACSTFEAKQPSPTSVVPPKQFSVPVGKNWQLIEEAPNLTDDRNPRLPFQSEQSVQPPGAPPVTPSDNRKLQTPR